jgi:metallo-beta-lactamase class B
VTAVGRSIRNISTTTRRWLAVLAVPAAVALFFFGREWSHKSEQKGQAPAEPFRIAGNLYYVGANDLASFLLTGPEGDVLIAGGYPANAPLVIANVAGLGFDIRDVKVLVNSDAFGDNAGALAALQQASGAALWISDADADVIAAGGAGGSSLGTFNFLTFLPFWKYPSPRVDHRFKDGDTIRLGTIELTAHVTGGHTPGSTSWSFPIHDGNRELLAIHVCNLDPPPALYIGAHPEIRAGFERSFRVLASLPADIWMTTHARTFGRYRKFTERANAKNPADPFIDRQGYLNYIDSAEETFRKLIGDGR